MQGSVRVKIISMTYFSELNYIDIHAAILKFNTVNQVLSVPLPLYHYGDQVNLVCIFMFVILRLYI